jgi:MoxR-like ATPase
MRQLAASTPVASHVQEGIARVIVATHPDHPTAPPLVKRYVAVGASPRGAQALMIGAKVNALLEQRFNVAYDDVEAVARPALRHRILRNFDGQADQISPDSIVDEALRAALRVSA